MLIAIPDVLSGDPLDRLRRMVLAAPWVDGNVTAGAQSALAKRNRQMPEDAPDTRAAQTEVMRALSACPLFLSAALPHTIFPPLFNRYGAGEAFGVHVDNAIRLHGASGVRIRSDLSATLFLGDPADYDGGDLVIEGRFGPQSVKLPAGHMVLYPSSSLHQVTPVMRGERIACFFWLQSLVRDAADREILFELDQTIQALGVEHGLDNAQVLALSHVYHNLVRRWAEP